MTVLDANGNKVQRDLGEKPGQDERSDPQIVPRQRTCVRMIKLRQKVQQGEAQEISPGKRVQELDVPRLVKLEQENAQCAQDNARKQQQVVHKTALQTICI